MPTERTGSAATRWRTAVALLTELRRTPGTTRAAAARRLGIGSGTATEVAARLRDLDLLAEVPVPTGGRGRPTAALTAHPAGPLVLAVEIRHDDWRVGVAGLDGRVELTAHERHGSRDARPVVAAVTAAAARAYRRWGDRVRTASLAVAATVRDGEVVQASTLGWGRVDLTAVAPAGVPLLIGNDATLGGVAEARTGAAASSSTALHLTVEVGVGGTLVVDGRPASGATGAGGEFGHLPLGDPALRCPCGARGCWDLEVDGRALARHLGAAAPTDPGAYLRHALDGGDDRATRSALDRLGTALGAGTAGLVNALDPDTVTLGGLAGPLRRHAPDAFRDAFTDGLMTFRRVSPPPVLDAVHGGEGALRGAVEVGLDEIVTEHGLAAWAARPRRSSH